MFVGPTPQCLDQCRISSWLMRLRAGFTDLARDTFNIYNQKGPEHYRSPLGLVVVMNDGFRTVAVLIFLLDHGRLVCRLTLLNNSGAIPINIANVVTTLTNAHTCSHRTNTHADIFR